MNKLKKFFYLAAIPILLAIILGFFTDIKTVIIVLFSFLLLEAYIIWKEKIGQELVVAFIISIAIASYYFYEYTTFNIIFGGINLFPIVLWTFGLVLLREIYEKVEWKNKFIKISVAYIIAIVIIEYIGYNFLGIRLNSNFPGLWGLEILHSPPALKIIYFVIGPVYLAITNYLEVK